MIADVVVFPAPLGPGLVQTLRKGLAGDPYLDVVEDHARELSAGSAGNVVSLTAETDDGIVGYAHAQETVPGSGTWFLDAIPLPAASDSRAVTLALIEGVQRELPKTSMQWWARGDHVQVADGLGLPRKRTVRRMELDLRSWVPPTDVLDVRPYANVDAGAVIDINNSAFTDHPDRSAWTVDDLDASLRALGNRFDDLLLAPHDGPADGFCWTKLHPGDVGEIFVLATHPRVRGTGLGGRLLHAGLVHIRETMSANVAVLYVEGDNQRAIALYGQSGFVDDGQPIVSYLLSSNAVLR